MSPYKPNDEAEEAAALLRAWGEDLDCLVEDRDFRVISYQLAQDHPVYHQQHGPEFGYPTQLSIEAEVQIIDIPRWIERGIAVGSVRPVQIAGLKGVVTVTNVFRHYPIARKAGYFTTLQGYVVKNTP